MWAKHEESNYVVQDQIAKMKLNIYYFPYNKKFIFILYCTKSKFI